MTNMWRIDICYPQVGCLQNLQLRKTSNLIFDLSDAVGP